MIYIISQQLPNSVFRSLHDFTLFVDAIIVGVHTRPIICVCESASFLLLSQIPTYSIRSGIVLLDQDDLPRSRATRTRVQRGRDAPHAYLPRRNQLMDVGTSPGTAYYKEFLHCFCFWLGATGAALNVLYKATRDKRKVLWAIPS